jgi:glycosyltransferase involved in cell wall biosynthesis
VERDEFRAVIPGCTVHVVPNGLDCAAFAGAGALDRTAYLDRFFPAGKIEPRKAVVLAAMGRLHVKKNFDVAIQALDRVRDVFPSAVLLIACGDDGERRPLQALIDGLGLTDRVALVGEVSGADKAEFLKGADLFLFPSHSENFGMVALEALAAGVPVIASRNTPWAEVESEGCGLWVDNTVDGFAAALHLLLPRDRSAMREKARALARRYDYSVVAGALETVYRNLLDDNQR